MQAVARRRRAGPSHSSTPPAALAAAHFTYSGNRQRAGGPARYDPLLHQRNGADVAAVIGFRPMGAAAIAEEAGRVGVGAVAEVFDPSDAGCLEPRQDVAREVEHGVAGGGGRA